VKNLAELYGLSPATMAGLAQIKGSAGGVDPGFAPHAGALDLDEDPDDPTTWAEVKSGQVRLPDGQTVASMAAPKQEASAAAPAPGTGWRFENGVAVDGPKDSPYAAKPAATPATEAEEREAVAGGAAAPPAAPSYTIPAHWQHQSASYATQYGMDPGELARGEEYRDEASWQGQMAANKRLDVMNRMAQAEGMQAAARIHANEVAQSRISQLNQERAQYVDQEKRRLEKLATEAQAKIDPEAHWKEKGSLAKVMAGIAIGLGQFGAMMRGGPNSALQIIQSEIDRNIDAQKANVANAKHAYDVRSNLYLRNLNEFGDKERAALATKINYLDTVAGLVDQQKALAKTDEAQAAWHDMQQSIAKERAGAADQFAIRTHDQKTEQLSDRFVPTQVVGGGAGAALKRPENLITLTDGTTVQMTNAPEHGEAVKKVQALDRLMRINNKIKQHRQAAEKLDPLTDRTEYQKNIAVLESLEIDKINAMSIASEQGVVKEAEYERAKAQQGMATQGLGTFKGNPVAASSREVADTVLDEQTKRWNEDQHAYVRAAGVPIVKKGYVQNAAGQLVPAGQYTGQDADLPATLAPRGSKPMDSRKSTPTQGAPIAETTPAAPRFDVQVAAKQTLKTIKGDKGGSAPKAPTPKRPK
jgi:hypothetical protein